MGGKAVIIQQQSAIEKATKGLFLCFTHKPNGTGHENHYNAIVDMESIPFHLIVNQDKSKTPTPATDPLTQQTQKPLLNWNQNTPTLNQKPGCHIYQQSQ